MHKFIKLTWPRLAESRLKACPYFPFRSKIKSDQASACDVSFSVPSVFSLPIPSVLRLGGNVAREALVLMTIYEKLNTSLSPSVSARFLIRFALKAARMSWAPCGRGRYMA